MKHERINSEGVAALVLLLTAYLVEYANNIILARYLSVTAYGDFVVTFRFVASMGILLLLGLDRSVLRFLPTYLHEQSWALADGFIRFSLYYLKGCCVLFFAVNAAVIACMMMAPKSEIGHWLQHHYLFWSIGLIPLYAAGQLLAMLLRGMGRITFSVFPGRILLYLLLSFFIAVVGYFVRPMPLYIALFVAAGVYFMTIGLQLWGVRREYHRLIVKEKAQFLYGEWVRSSLPLMVSDFMFNSIVIIDLLILEFFSPSESDVGVFAAVSLVAGVFLVIQRAMMLVYAPYITPLVREKNYTLLQQCTAKLNRQLVCIVCCLMAVFFILAPHILLLFGPSYLQGVVAFRLVTIGAGIASFSVLSVSLIQYATSSRVLLGANAFLCCFAVIVNLFFIYYYHLLGAAIALVVVRCTMALVYLFLAKKHVPIKLLALR